MKTKILTYILISNFGIVFSQNILSIQDIGCCDKSYPTLVLFDSFHSPNCNAYIDSNFINLSKKTIKRRSIDTFTIHSTEFFDLVVNDSIFNVIQDSAYLEYGTIRIRIFKCNDQFIYKNLDISSSLCFLNLVHKNTIDTLLKKRIEEWIRYIELTKVGRH